MSMENEQEVLELEGKFKTAAELGLSEAQRCGLVKALAFMEAGKLSHAPKSYKNLTEDAPFTGHFNMGNWRVMSECGTICCIGGTAELLGNCNLRTGGGTMELTRLFYPPPNGVGAEGWGATPRQAAVALRGYLETGHTNWQCAMKSPQ